jgi:hypothetical protein
MTKTDKSRLSREKVEKILTALMDRYHFSTYKELTDWAGYESSNVQQWKKRGSVPFKRFHSKDRALNRQFFETGDGEISTTDYNPLMSVNVRGNILTEPDILYVATNPIDQKLIDLQRTLSVASALPKSDRAKLDAVQDSVELMRSLLRDLEELVRVQKGKSDADS